MFQFASLDFAMPRGRHGINSILELMVNFGFRIDYLKKNRIEKFGIRIEKFGIEFSYKKLNPQISLRFLQY